MNEEILGAIQSRCKLVFKLAQLDFKGKLILSLVKVKRIITGSSNSPMENVHCAVCIWPLGTDQLLPPVRSPELLLDHLQRRK